MGVGIVQLIFVKKRLKIKSEGFCIIRKYCGEEKMYNLQLFGWHLNMLKVWNMEKLSRIAKHEYRNPGRLFYQKSCDEQDISSQRLDALFFVTRISLWCMILWKETICQILLILNNSVSHRSIILNNERTFVLKFGDLTRVYQTTFH